MSPEELNAHFDKILDKVARGVMRDYYSFEFQYKSPNRWLCSILKRAVSLGQETYHDTMGFGSGATHAVAASAAYDNFRSKRSP